MLFSLLILPAVQILNYRRTEVPQYNFLTDYQVFNAIYAVYRFDQHIPQYLQCPITLRVHAKSPVNKHKNN